MRHVRKLNQLKGKTECDRLMLEKHRKTLVVCEKCYAKIHSHAKQSHVINGEPYAWRHASTVWGAATKKQKRGKRKSRKERGASLTGGGNGRGGFKGKGSSSGKSGILPLRPLQERKKIPRVSSSRT